MRRDTKIYRVVKAMALRMSDYLTANSLLTADAHIGDTKITVADSTNFGLEAINNSFPTILLRDKNSTGKRIQGGLQGTELVYIKEIYANVIELNSPLVNNWTVANTARIQRAPAGIPVDNIILGDIAVAAKFPFLSIIPINKTISWKTLSGTMDHIQIDFVVYLKDDDTQTAMENVMILADCVEWILMSNLHIKPYGYTNDWEKTSYSICKQVQYGTIQKGSEFLKAATLSWECDLYFWRGFLSSQGLSEQQMYGSLQNFGPLHS